MSRSAHFGKDTQNYLVDGLNQVANAVKSTLGPAGKTVIIQRPDKSPLITKDGVSVAKSLAPKDEKIKLGADLAISIAQKQMDSVGDGTTTATVLGQAIVNTGIRQIELSETPVNRTSLKNGIDKAKDFVIEQLEGLAKDISTDEELISIATVSANGDEKLGRIVAEAYQKVGKAGVVLVEETKDRDIRLDFKEGMNFNKGWTAQFFVTNHDKQSVEFDNPLIMLCNSKLSNVNILANVIKSPLEANKPLVIIAESFDSVVTNWLAYNKMASRGELKIACIEAPGYGDRRLEILRDLAAYTGAKVIDDALGTSLEGSSAADFGTCEKIVIKKDETVISGNPGNEDAIKERIELIQGLQSALKENEQFEHEQLNKRLAALTTGVAVIQVGGSSEEEIKELKDRLDDAQWAVKAALEEGYLPGAGNTLLMLSEKVLSEVEGKNADEALGVFIFAKAMRAPARTILENAGQAAEVILDKVLSDKDVAKGYNAKTNEYVDLYEAGIIDPAKVVKGTVYAAASIAGTTLTTSVMITEDKEENQGMAFNMMPPMM